MSVEKNLKNLNLTIPIAPDPVGNYLAYVKSNNLIFISGQLPIDTSGKVIEGKIGLDLNNQDGEKATKLAILNVLGQLQKATGDLNLIKKCIKITGYYNCTENFKDHPKLLNIASDLIVGVFEEKGKHARAVVGVSSLPLNAAVELETVFEI
jgi:enamine deaminase RidA (YjgF/YER057c/UK114 family)